MQQITDEDEILAWFMTAWVQLATFSNRGPYRLTEFTAAASALRCDCFDPAQSR